MAYEYAGENPCIGQKWQMVKYMKQMPNTRNLDRSIMPADVALEIINSAESVEESKRQQAFNGYGLIVDGGKMLFSLEDFKKSKGE